ncbi:MAG: zinc-ribbon domain-containing protein [Deltaproteobacteria bacterium]|nr:zinc-ribbon domain-containing protein [Deltaproteobacteria bacterium]
MIIQCDKCSTKFRLDDSRITANGVRVRCTKCQNVFVVTPPPQAEEVQVEEVFGAKEGAKAPEPSFTGAPNIPRPESRPDLNLKFDFERPPDEEDLASSRRPSEASDEDERDPFEFKFSSSETAEKETPEDLAEGNDEGFRFKPEESGKAALDFDFNFDDAGKTADETAPGEERAPSDDWGLGSGSGTEGEKDERDDALQVKASPISAAAYARDSMASAPKAEPLAEKDDYGAGVEKEFSDVLTKSIEEDADLGLEEGEDDANLKAAVTATKSKPGKKAILIAVLVFIIGAVFVYSTGVIDSITKSILSGSETTAKVVEIETINGYFAENVLFGKVFVVEAKIRNISDSPQEIKSVTGILYDSKGEKLTSKSVSPGRVVSQDDLRNLSKEDLQKQFKDATGGTIPSKAEVPVMVLFTDAPAETVEYGLDIVR